MASYQPVSLAHGCFKTGAGVDGMELEEAMVRCWPLLTHHLGYVVLVGTDHKGVFDHSAVVMVDVGECDQRLVVGQGDAHHQCRGGVEYVDELGGQARGAVLKIGQHRRDRPLGHYAAHTGATRKAYLRRAHQRHVRRDR